MKIKFVKIVFVVVVTMIFVKVYQHNAFVKVSYELQYLKYEKNKLKKYKTELLLRYNQEKNSEKNYAWAVNECGMQPCSLEAMVSLNDGRV